MQKIPEVYDEYSRPDDPGIVCSETKLTKDSEMQGCDINWIVNQYAKNGIPIQPVEELYADVSMMGGFKEAMDYIADAESQFMQLPWQVRKRFNDNAAAFVDFCSDEKNRPEMEALGLLVEKPTAPAAPAAPVAAPAGAAAPGTAPAGA